MNPGGGSLTYLWDFGDGQTSTAANPIHTYIRSGVSTLHGASHGDELLRRVLVGNRPDRRREHTAGADDHGAGRRHVACCRARWSPSRAPPPIPTTARSARRRSNWTVLLHHNTHVHTFVGGTGTSGSFVAENHGTIGTFSYEIILEATDSSGLKTTTSVNVPRRPGHGRAVGAVGVDGRRPELEPGPSSNWSASTDNGAVERYRVERCQGAGCSSFTQVGSAVVDELR